ncbi:hypothetical protein [Streptomyces sp. NPDC058308]|uniref:hypothetical protein n=1 Tax=Streptomyces sp. NPDC058308 TaxID=3346440 RepID=UPI0036F00A7B
MYLHDMLLGSGCTVEIEPGMRRLKAGLKRWLASLDPDQVIVEYERKEPLPKHT